MTWPESPITPSGGWTLSFDLLVSPDGQAFGPGDLLTMQQVAQIWGYSYDTLRNNASRYGFSKIGPARVMQAGAALGGPPARKPPGRPPNPKSS